MNDQNDGYEVFSAFFLVSSLAFIVIGFWMMNDRCLIQMPSVPQMTGTLGSPTPISEETK